MIPIWLEASSVTKRWAYGSGSPLAPDQPVAKGSIRTQRLREKASPRRSRVMPFTSSCTGGSLVSALDADASSSGEGEASTSMACTKRPTGVTARGEKWYTNNWHPDAEAAIKTWLDASWPLSAPPPAAGAAARRPSRGSKPARCRGRPAPARCAARRRALSPRRCCCSPAAGRAWRNRRRRAPRGNDRPRRPLHLGSARSISRGTSPAA
mmetsp:Transcript_45564/g.120425  ORF Transcript_45564/g.120425 Transcript_45564/m.120425 type:complete len:210 (+) Transcript_45564:190-819(+)